MMCLRGIKLTPRSHEELSKMNVCLNWEACQECLATEVINFNVLISEATFFDESFIA
jgi:hypothetical protein